MFFKTKLNYLSIFLLLFSLSCGDSSPKKPEPISCNLKELEKCELSKLPLKSKGSKVFDSWGRAVLLRGVNTANSWKNIKKPFSDHVEADFAHWRNMGFNSLRMLTAWAKIMPEKGKIDEKHLAELAKRIDWAQKHDLLIILDMHQDLYGYGFGVGNGAPAWSCDQKYYDMLKKPISPWFLNYTNNGIVACYDNFWEDQELQNYFAVAWEAAAKFLKDKENLVGINLLNEPYWGSLKNIKYYEQKSLYPLHQKTLKKVREHMPKRIHFMEPGAVKNLQGLTRLPKPDYLNYVYSPHIYHTEMESGDGYKKEYLKYFKEQVAKDLVQAKDFDSGLFYGEWGAIGHRDQKKYNTFIKDLTALFDDHNIHWTIWESGSSIEKSKESFENSFWVRDLSRPYPAAWPFDNLKFSYDPEAKKIRISSKSLLNSVIPIAQIRLPSWVKSSKIIDKPSCLTSNRTINGDLFLEFNSKEWDKDLEIEFK